MKLQPDVYSLLQRKSKTKVESWKEMGFKVYITFVINKYLKKFKGLLQGFYSQDYFRKNMKRFALKKV